MLLSVSCTTLDAPVDAPIDAAATLIHSFVSRQMGYCNSLLHGVPKCHIDKLQRVQQVAARLVVMEGKFCDIIPVLHQLHWLPVSFRIYFKILLLTLKAINELAPSCSLLRILLKNFGGVTCSRRPGANF